MLSHYMGIFDKKSIVKRWWIIKEWEANNKRISGYPSLLSLSQQMSGGALSSQLLTPFDVSPWELGLVTAEGAWKIPPTSQTNYISLVTCVWTHLPFKNKTLYKSQKKHVVSSHHGLIIAYIILFLKSVFFWIMGMSEIVLENSKVYQSYLKSGQSFFFSEPI